MRSLHIQLDASEPAHSLRREGQTKRRRVLVILLLVICLPVLSAYGQQGDPQGPPKQESAPSSSLGQPLETNAPAPVDPNTYQIGPEDVLLIRVWREPELSGTVVVRPDGKITLPLVGEVTAGGRTPAALRKEITERLSEFITRPEVLVQVQAVRSKKYYVIGKVNRTGAFPLVVPTTVLEALSAAGGFQPWAKKNKIVILRGNQRLRFNYDQVIQGKNLEQNIYLQNGDYIIVP